MKNLVFRALVYGGERERGVKTKNIYNSYRKVKIKIKIVHKDEWGREPCEAFHCYTSIIWKKSQKKRTEDLKMFGQKAEVMKNQQQNTVPRGLRYEYMYLLCTLTRSTTTVKYQHVVLQNPWIQSHTTKKWFWSHNVVYFSAYLNLFNCYQLLHCANLLSSFGSKTNRQFTVFCGYFMFNQIFVEFSHVVALFSIFSVYIKLQFLDIFSF